MYLYAHRLLDPPIITKVSLCSVWALTQKSTTNQSAENTCQWSPHSQRAYLYHSHIVNPTAQVQLRKRDWQDCKSQRSGWNILKQCLGITKPCTHGLTTAAVTCKRPEYSQATQDSSMRRNPLLKKKLGKEIFYLTCDITYLIMYDFVIILKKWMSKNIVTRIKVNKETGIYNCRRGKFSFPQWSNTGYINISKAGRVADLHIRGSTVFVCVLWFGYSLVSFVLFCLGCCFVLFSWLLWGCCGIVFSFVFHGKLLNVEWVGSGRGSRRTWEQ